MEVELIYHSSVSALTENQLLSFFFGTNLQLVFFSLPFTHIWTVVYFRVFIKEPPGNPCTRRTSSTHIDALRLSVGGHMNRSPIGSKEGGWLS